MKKIFSILALALGVCITLYPTFSFATEDSVPKSDTASSTAGAEIAKGTGKNLVQDTLRHN